MTVETAIPDTQHAVQLTGPSQLRLNTAKEVVRPGPRQILARVEATSLCFSDLKLLKQFTAHPRKDKVVRGISPEALKEIPSYRPGDLPTVPGHETVCRIVAVGDQVTRHELGERVLVQADYRKLRTPTSNGAFGYNFEGGLQEYVLMDERVVIEPDTHQRYLLPADGQLSASAVALAEPWACVENSYTMQERQTIKPKGRLLVVAEAGFAVTGLAESFSPGPDGRPASITAVCASDDQLQALQSLAPNVTTADDAEPLDDESFDDIVYFGSSKAVIDVLNDKLAAYGIFNIVLAGRKIGQLVSVGVGRLHYGPTRWIGTPSANAAESYKSIPATGEVRPGDRVAVVGAGGPMGQMHTIRALCLDEQDVSVTATDLDDARLQSLRRKANPLAQRRNVPLRLVNTKTEPLAETFTYLALMAPLGVLVAQAIEDSDQGALINIFAGIPAPTRHDLDIDTYIEKQCFMFGTSGSRIADLQAVLDKVTQGQLDTDCSVDAISGMAGAIDGIAAVEARSVAGKIVVYPPLHDVPLIPLAELGERYPTVAEKLQDGMWNRAAEDELLKVAAGD